MIYVLHIYGNKVTKTMFYLVFILEQYMWWYAS